MEEQHCEKCKDYNKNYHYNNKDRYNEAQRTRYEEDEEYRKKKLEQKHNFNLKTIICSVCNCSIRQHYFSRHIKTNTHERHLNNGLL